MSKHRRYAYREVLADVFVDDNRNLDPDVANELFVELKPVNVRNLSKIDVLIIFSSLSGCVQF